MRQLIEVWNTHDARHIFKAEPDEWPENINNIELVKSFEEILKEYEHLRDSVVYDNHLRDEDYKLYQMLKTQALWLLLQCVGVGNEESANEIMTAFKFNFQPTIKEIERQLKLMNNYFTLHNEKEQKEERKEISWFDLIAYIEENSSFKVDYNCPVAMYVAYENRVKQIIDAKRKAQSNGKED